MKILIDLQACQTPGSRNRGIGRYSMSLAMAMVREGRGHEFWLLLNNRFPETLAPIRAAFAGLLPTERIVEFASPHGIQALIPGSGWRAGAAVTIRQAIIDAIDPDIVHVSSLFEGLTDDSVATLAPSGSGRALQAVTLYDLIPLRYPERYLGDEQVRRYYTSKANSLVHADLLLGISAHSTQEALDLVPGIQPGRAVNISSAIDDGFADIATANALSPGLRSKLAPSRRMVMYTGGIDWRKNIEGLIQAFARLPGALRNQHQLVLVCHIEPKVAVAMAEFCSSIGLQQDDVVFTDFVSDADLVALYKTCRLFVFPSLHEGFGLPVLEALRCGAVVIASNCSSVPEVIGNPEATFDPTHVDQICAVMQRALTDEAFRARALSRSQEHAKQFSWASSARRALEAMESAWQRKGPAPAGRPDRPSRPRLAMVTPLPPDQSGIADYAAELLPPLSRHYDITVIWKGATGAPAAAAGAWQVASVDWFEANSRQFDRVLYQFGNSSFHDHMFRLLRDHPGVVVMHDFYLSGVIDWMESSGDKNVFGRHLIRSHGREGAEFGMKEGRWSTVLRYPCNRWVLERAKGVIVHSEHARELAHSFYGPGAADDWSTIPLLKERPASVDRQAARAALGLPDDAVLVCSFGHLAPTKLNDRLLLAWAKVCARVPVPGKYHLVFVGQNDPGNYGKSLAAAVAELGPRANVQITGFADNARFATYLAAADLAVQLRTNSRGETSKAILDCMAFGLPVVVNANGSMAEYPRDAVCLLPDGFGDSELVEALVTLLTTPAERAGLAERGLALVSSRHAPETVAALYERAIESYHAHPHGQHYWELLQRLADLPGDPDDFDTVETAVAISASLNNA